MEVQSQNTKIITESQFSAIMEGFQNFEPSPHIAVAVSGGGDSMALALLAKQWVLKVSGHLTALVVDHGLRQESATEAQWVRDTLTSFEIPTHILSWKGPKPVTRIQERARQERYNLLEDWCMRHGVLHLLVAHHQDDQWETVMYRLSKGSDLAGLLGMKAVVNRSFGRMLRPLLTFSKESLKATLANYGSANIQDPSNFNDKFTRVKWRNVYPLFAELGLNAEQIFKSISTWRGTYQIYQHVLDELLIKACTLDLYGGMHVSLTMLLKEMPQIQRRSIQRILTVFGGDAYGVELKTVDHLLDRLLTHSAVTGAGCYLIKRQKELFIMRELRSIPQVTTITSQRFMWDHRFEIMVPEIYLGGQIRPFGDQQAHQWCKEFQVHSRLLATLPALYQDNRFVGLIHHLAASNPDIKVCCFHQWPLIN